MNKLTKVLLGAGAFLVMSGGLLSLTGWATGADVHAMDWAGSSRSRVSASTPSTPVPSVYLTEEASGGSSYRESTDMDPFSKVDIDIDLGDVQVISSNSFGVYLDWKGRNYALDYEVDGDTLKVSSKDVKIQGGHTGVNVDLDNGSVAVEVNGQSVVDVGWNPDNLGVNLGGYEGTVIVYVPEGASLDELDITNDLGNIEVYGLSVDKLNIKCSLGDLHVESVTARTAGITSNMGDINCYSFTVTEQLDLENDMGGVDLYGDLRGEADVEVSMGDLSLCLSQPEERYSYTIETDMGEVTVNGASHRSRSSRTGGENHLDLENSMGDITVEFGIEF